MTKAAVTNSPRGEVKAIAMRPAAAANIRIAATEYVLNNFIFIHYLPEIHRFYSRLFVYIHISLVLQKLVSRS